MSMGDITSTCLHHGTGMYLTIEKENSKNVREHVYIHSKNYPIGLLTDFQSIMFFYPRKINNEFYNFMSHNFGTREPYYFRKILLIKTYQNSRADAPALDTREKRHFPLNATVLLETYLS